LKTAFKEAKHDKSSFGRLIGHDSAEF